MKKRTFLKLSSVVLTGSLLPPMSSCKESKNTRNAAKELLSTKEFNWARNFEYSTQDFQYPKSTEQLKELVKEMKHLRALGTRHSFNRIADSTEHIVSLRELNKVISLDKEARTVTVEAGIRYGELAEYLHKEGYALHNLASLPHISVAGACATATHGSGVKNGNLSTEIVALELLTAAGETVQLSAEKDKETFYGAVVGLGALGVVTKLTLQVQPTFLIRQDVYRNMPLAQLKEHFEEVMSAGYSVSLFTNWANQNINQVWIKRRVEEGMMMKISDTLFGATLATKKLHPIEAISAEHCTEQQGIPGPWHERLPHFKMNFTPSSGEELQSEFFVPRDKGVQAIQAMFQLADLITPHLLISEVRTIAADSFWMSPCYEQDSVALHFTWKQDWPAVSKILPIIEEKLAPFQARPHWAKLFTMSPMRLQSLYKKLPDFKNLVMQYDPEGKFQNAFLEKNLYGV
ncbi:FAD-binding protein [Siphonobacter sp.]|uniref:FAD-binding protein n=1 Tax=Siphonobacter sp. TaxID=1869184 RepID=UPI003B3BD516